MSLHPSQELSLPPHTPKRATPHSRDACATFGSEVDLVRDPWIAAPGHPGCALVGRQCCGGHRASPTWY